MSIGWGYEARFVNRQKVRVKDFENEHRYRLTIRASLPLDEGFFLLIITSRQTPPQLFPLFYSFWPVDAFTSDST